MKEHKARMHIQIDAQASIVAFEKDRRPYALLCFESYYAIGSESDLGSYRACETFDGSTVERSYSTKYHHRSACLGLYKGSPTAIGTFNRATSDAPVPGDADYSGGQTEILGENGWESIEKHPA